MKDTVQLFIDEIKNKPHVQPLITKANLSIELITEVERVSMGFFDGAVCMNPNDRVLYKNWQMTGREEGMVALLAGQEKLRSLAEKKVLTIKAPFRTILLLESIFYLAKAEQEQPVG